MKRILGMIGLIVCAAAARGADVGELVKQLKSDDNEVRRAAAKALEEGGVGSKAAVPALINALKDRDTFVRRYAAQALGAIGPDAHAAVPALTATLNDSRREVQESAARALGKLGPSGVETLVVIARDGSKDAAMRRQAIDSLSNLGRAGRSAVPALTELLKESTSKGKKKAAPEDLRVAAANALGSLATRNDKETIKILEALTDKKAKTPRDLRQAANQSLRTIRKNK
ncbi:MAG TPA: HEAT repeat domain-containing protein [Gemmataceae bacterium]|nr:HEAT repeat domain-containing protein [Gemmataceae bacterium]